MKRFVASRKEEAMIRRASIARGNALLPARAFAWSRRHAVETGMKVLIMEGQA